MKAKNRNRLVFVFISCLLAFLDNTTVHTSMYNLSTINKDNDGFLTPSSTHDDFRHIHLH